MSKKMSMLLFSGEYDKALAALILANTAREMQIDVTMFFAFWGLNLLRNTENVASEYKSTYEKMLSMLTPKGPEQLPLSRLNMLGIGKEMLKEMMATNDKPNLRAFLEGARNKGVRFCGCKLSMEVMGITEGELLPELEVVEAKDYLKDALNSDMQLFI